jgi:hypothetical protein
LAGGAMKNDVFLLQKNAQMANARIKKGIEGIKDWTPSNLNCVAGKIIMWRCIAQMNTQQRNQNN